MGFVQLNVNPVNNIVGDCVIRGISFLLKQDWDETYLDIVSLGFALKDMPSSNRVWGEYMKEKGFKRILIPDTCPACYTIRDFCTDHSVGDFLLATGSHVVAVSNGDYYDTWDSGGEVPVYFWRKET